MMITNTTSGTCVRIACAASVAVVTLASPIAEFSIFGDHKSCKILCWQPPAQHHQPYGVHLEKLTDTTSSSATGPGLVDYSKVIVVTS
jgi:phospholipase/lecithinase/hemolysin